MFVHSCRESCTVEIDMGSEACTVRTSTWDNARPDLLAYHVLGRAGGGSCASVVHVDVEQGQVALLDSQPLEPHQALISIAVPYLLVAAQGGGDGDAHITKVILTPFEGLPLLDPVLLSAVLDFNIAVYLDDRQAIGQVGRAVTALEHCLLMFDWSP